MVAVIIPAQLSVAVGKVEITVWQSPVTSGILAIFGTGATVSPTITFTVKLPSQPPDPDT